MAAENISGDENQKTFDQLVCRADVTAGVHGHLAFISALNIILSITAFLGNALILAALRKESSLHPPSKLLLRSLATTDLCAGLISAPLFVIYLMTALNEFWSICRYVVAARLIIDPTLVVVSLLTMTAISVDRLLALLLGLRYKQVVTLKRTYAIVITFWVVSTAVSLMHLWNSLIILIYGSIVISLCVATSILSYTKIFRTLHHRQNQAHDQAQQSNQANALNIARYRKAVYSALWLQLTLATCYSPEGITLAFVSIGGLSPSTYVAWCYVHTLFFLNSSLNPILYCWKIDEVRQAVKGTIRQVLCCS